MTCAVITARGGSTRLPRKNVKLFCGLPLVAWSIIQARYSKLIDEVYVSTDDDEIANVAIQYGAKVIRRPNWPNPNAISANRPMCHAIEEIKKIHGDAFDTVVTILPTTPLNKPGDFDKGIELFRKFGADTIRPLIPQRETVVMKKLSNSRARCDLFDKKYNYLGEGGGWCVTSPEWYLNYCGDLASDLDVDLDKMENWSARECYYFEQEYWQYADVDTAEEFAFAEVVFNHYVLKNNFTEWAYKQYYLNAKSEQHEAQKE